MNTTTDYTADAPDFSAWAGTGEHVERIYASGDPEAMTELRDRYNTAVAARVADGTDTADAMADLDVEDVASGISITHTATCRYCDTAVTWTTAADWPSDTEAPLDERGQPCCDICYAKPLDER